MNAGQDHLFELSLCKIVKMDQCICHRHAAAAAAGVGNNTVSTKGVAAVLNFQKGAGAGFRRNRGHGVKTTDLPNILMNKRRSVRSRRNLFDHPCNCHLIRMSHNVLDTIDGPNVIGCCLGVTTGHHDFCIWVVANGLTNGLSGLHGGLCGYRAGVDDNQVGLVIF